MGEIRFVENRDKAEWYKFDNHLPEAVFEEKVRTRQGYEQPMEMIMIKGIGG